MSDCVYVYVRFGSAIFSNMWECQHHVRTSHTCMRAVLLALCHTIYIASRRQHAVGLPFTMDMYIAARCNVLVRVKQRSM